MIYCPQCGTPNKPNSKFCKNCAAPLAPSTDVRCPICGTMNPQDATTCSNCGSRLVTNAAGTPAPEQTTPADAPETIAPFNPPDIAPEPEAPTAAPSTSAGQALRGEASHNRPTFGRANSEWLRRIRKTTGTTADDRPPTAEASPLTDSRPPTAKVSSAIEEQPTPSAETSAPSAKAATPPVENVTQEPEAATLAAAVTETAQAVTTTDTPAGTAQPVTAPDAPAQTTQVVSTPTAQLTPPGEMKLTGDSYDYSDIGGHVTDEMHAELQAQSSTLGSMDDEVALARRLLGLDVETTADSQPPTVETVTPTASNTPLVEAPVVEASKAETLTPAPTAQVSTPIQAEAGAAEPAAPVEEKQDSDWIAALAAASSTAVAEQQSDEGQAQTTAETVAPATEVVTTPSITPPASEAVTTPSTPPASEVVTASSELPNWLSELAPGESASGTTTETASTDAAAEPITAEGQMPAWVQALKPETAPAETGGLLDRLPDLDEQERQELPDWLREPIAPATEPEVAMPSEEVTANEEADAPPEVEPAPAPMGTFELPAWFTSGAQPPSHLPADPFETIETTGPLAGVSGIIPLAVAIAEPHSFPQGTPAKSDGGRIFQTILAEPLAPAARAPAEVASKPLFTINHLLYLLIFVAALIPMFLPLDLAGLGLNTASGPSADFYSQLQAIPAGATVLVAFDYTPGQSVELNPAASVIVNDLAARHVNVVALSTNPYGAALAQNVLAQAQAAQPSFTFVNLGFLFGNEAGLRNLALGWLPSDRPDLNGVAWGASPLASSVRRFDDLGLAVIIAGDSTDLRTWMEQVQPRVQSPIIAATTAVLEPQARTYVNARQLQASLRGLTGAAELELSSNQTGPVVKTVDALSFVSLLLAGIIVLANVAWLVRRK